MEGDDRTFRLNFTSGGVTKLRERVTEKLKEFMGDYTDDTLVEYVIVLLKNGRRKDEAKNELNVFLGDDSDPFVSWLWDHLGSHLDLYVQQREPHLNIVPKLKSAIREQVGRNDLKPNKSVGENEISGKTPRNRHNRELKRSKDEDQVPPTLRSAVVTSVNLNDESERELHQMKRSHSPQPMIQKKRRRHEDRQLKKEEVSQASSNAPRRLLQFAVRDAVATSRPSNSTAEPSLKRLRSVVSTSTGNSSLEEGPQRNQSVAGARTAMSAAIKAVAEAAKDVSKVRPSGNVFDRLGRATDVMDASDDVRKCEEDATDGPGGSLGDVMEDVHSPYLHNRNDFSRQYEGNVSSFMRRVITSDSAYNGEGFDDEKTVDISRPGAFRGNRGDNPSPFQHGSTDDEILGRTRQNQVQPEIVTSTAHKTVTPSVKVNPRKSSSSQEVKKVPEIDGHERIEGSNIVAANSGVQMQLMKENNNPTVSVNGNVKDNADLQMEPLKKTLPPWFFPTSAPRDDVDSRTIFVSNVHFAATKDSLSRHFNKFGEVLKAIILTDPSTGQPKGSAYVEFMKKESAELALSLDGTSFMSRILKIVKKSSAQPETTSITVWPPVSRASPYPIPRYSRAPFARGGYRGRVAMKPGARSFQWKRDGQSTAATETSAQNAIPSPTTRSLTYVRTEPKANGGTDTA